jgi:hypothetical protein
MVDDEIFEFKTLEAGENPQFDNFFKNSFMHFYLRCPEFQDLDDDLRLLVANDKCAQIRKMGKFMVGFDKFYPTVFYTYTAYTLSENKLYLHMAYVKKNFRGFGFFKHSLDVLKESANEYYYTLPIKLKRKYYLPEFERKSL